MFTHDKRNSGRIVIANLPSAHRWQVIQYLQSLHVFSSALNIKSHKLDKCDVCGNVSNRVVDGWNICDVCLNRCVFGYPLRQVLRPPTYSVPTLIRNAKYALGALLCTRFRITVQHSTMHCDICIHANMCSNLKISHHERLLMNVCVCKTCHRVAKKRAAEIRLQYTSVWYLSGYLLPEILPMVRAYMCAVILRPQI